MFFCVPRTRQGSAPPKKIWGWELLPLEKKSGTLNEGILTYISCMDTAYVREFPHPPISQPYKVQYLHVWYLELFFVIYFGYKIHQNTIKKFGDQKILSRKYSQYGGIFGDTLQKKRVRIPPNGKMTIIVPRRLNYPPNRPSPHWPFTIVCLIIAPLRCFLERKGGEIKKI